MQMRMLKRLSKLVKLSVISLSAIHLASCKTTDSKDETIKEMTTKVACESFPDGIHWSKKDTVKTIEQIKEYNAVGKAICGWK